MALLLTGCFGGKVSLPIGENGEKVTIEEDGEGVTIEGENGDSISFGEQKLPEGWPDDIPLADDYEVISSFSTKESGQTSLSLMYVTTKMTFDEVWELYTSYASTSGYTQSYEAATPGYNTLVLEGEGETLSFSVSSEEGSKEITVLISIVLVESTN